MGRKQSLPNYENKEEGATKIQETNWNLGLVYFQQESFNFNRVHGIKIGVIFIITGTEEHSRTWCNRTTNALECSWGLIGS